RLLSMRFSSRASMTSCTAIWMALASSSAGSRKGVGRAARAVHGAVEVAKIFATQRGRLALHAVGLEVLAEAIAEAGLIGEGRHGGRFLCFEVWNQQLTFTSGAYLRKFLRFSSLGAKSSAIRTYSRAMETASTLSCGV